MCVCVRVCSCVCVRVRACMCVCVCMRGSKLTALFCAISLSPPMPGQHHAPSISHPLTSHVCTCREKGAVSSITPPPPPPPPPQLVHRLMLLSSRFHLFRTLVWRSHLLTPYFDCKQQYTFNIYHRVTLWMGTKNVCYVFPTKTALRTTLVDALVACQRRFLPGQVALSRSKWNHFVHLWI